LLNLLNARSVIIRVCRQKVFLDLLTARCNCLVFKLFCYRLSVFRQVSITSFLFLPPWRIMVRMPEF